MNPLRWWQDLRARCTARTALMALCWDCHHPWWEHRGSGIGAGPADACGECHHELDHGFRTHRTVCTVAVPARLRALVDGRLA